MPRLPVVFNHLSHVHVHDVSGAYCAVTVYNNTKEKRFEYKESIRKENIISRSVISWHSCVALFVEVYIRRLVAMSWLQFGQEC